MIAHLGMAVLVTGVTIVSMYELSEEVRLEYGEGYQLGEYTYTLKSVKPVTVDNYSAQRGHIDVTKNGELVASLYPEKRDYGQGNEIMTEAGIDGDLFRDLFVALAYPGGKDVWLLNVFYKPFVRWIWIGAAMMGLGGLLAAIDKRYRRVRKIKSKVVTKKVKNELKTGQLDNEQVNTP